MEEKGCIAVLPLGHTSLHVWKAPWKREVGLLYSHWDILYMYGKPHGREMLYCCTPTGIYMYGKPLGRENLYCCAPTAGFQFGIGHRPRADNLRIWQEIIWHCWQNGRLFQNKWPKRPIHATYASNTWSSIFVDKLSQSAKLGRIHYSLLRSENCKLSISNN